MTPKSRNPFLIHVIMQVLVLGVLAVGVVPTIYGTLFFVPVVAPDALLLTSWAVCPPDTEATVITRPVFRGGVTFDMECKDRSGNVVLTAEDWSVLPFAGIVGSTCCLLTYLPLVVIGFVVGSRMARSKTIS